jgi:[protein-PII] uridylyltransferase
LISVPYAPLVDAGEVLGFLRRVPLAVDGERFLRFALGFPRRYLEQTAPVEVVRHFALMEALGKRAVISSLAGESGRWQLCIVARDRSFLFARIAGSLSAFGMDIVRAEAFANANALVLDTFGFADRKGRFEDSGERRAFQHLLEEAIEDRASLPEPAPPEGAAADREPLRLSWQDDVHPTFTRLLVEGPDRFGLLFRLSRAISEAGCSIEIAAIETPGGLVRDEFYLSEQGSRVQPATRAALEERLPRL